MCLCLYSILRVMDAHPQVYVYIYIHDYNCTFYGNVMWRLDILIHPDLGRITTQNKWQTMWHLTLSQPLWRPAVVLSTGWDLKGTTKHAKSRFVASSDLLLSSDIKVGDRSIYLKEPTAYFHAYCIICIGCIHRI